MFSLGFKRWPWYFQVYEVLDLWPLAPLFFVLEVDPAWGLVTNKCYTGHWKVCGDTVTACTLRLPRWQHAVELVTTTEMGVG